MKDSSLPDSSLSQKQAPRLALFDLDGTFLAWDTQALFCNFILQKRPLRRFLHLPYLMSLPFYGLGILSEETLKRLFLTYLYGLTLQELKNYAQEFASLYFPAQCYPDVLECLRRHQEEGDTCVLISASPTFYARAIGEKLGFKSSLVFGTEIEGVSATLKEETRLSFFPRLPLGANKSEAKVRRLQEEGILAPSQALPPAGSVAYSDSTADLPLLKACELKVLIHPSEKLEQAFREEERVSFHPERPYATQKGRSLGMAQQVLGFFPIPSYSKGSTHTSLPPFSS